MNGKKAKAFRRAAGMTNKASVSYATKQGTQRNIPIPAHNVDGSVKLDQEGKPVFRGTIETKTMVLDRCARQVYQVLKGLYKGKSFG